MNMTDDKASKRLTRGPLFLCAALLLAGVPSPGALAAGASSAYTKVYEPVTSLPLAATVGWRADDNAIAVAGGEVRPSSAFVYLDASLRVLGEEGEEIAPALSVYLDSTAHFMIPVLSPWMKARQTRCMNCLQMEPGRTSLSRQATKTRTGSHGLRRCRISAA